MPILVAILLGVLALAFVLYPLYEWGGREQGDRDRGGARHFFAWRAVGNLAGASPATTLAWPNVAPNGRSGTPCGRQASESQQTDREEAARAALQEIELDFQLGNIGEEEYRSLHERYMHHALLALKARHDREQEIDEEIEEQLRRMREKNENTAQ